MGSWRVWAAVVCLLGLATLSHEYALKCDRTPEGAGATKSPADGRFRIRIQGNIERYNPSEVYNSECLRMV